MHHLPRSRCSSLLHLKLQTEIHIKQIHAQVIINGITSPSLHANLIQQYNSITSNQTSNLAHSVFTNFTDPNLFLFNTLLRTTQPKDSIHVFTKWVSKCRLNFDDITYISVLGACARCSSVSTLWLGRQVHVGVLKHGFMLDVLVQTSLVHFYGCNKDILSARMVFDEMSVRNSITWNAMIKGYCSQKEKGGECGYKALDLFKDMLSVVNGVKPTATTMVCVISASARLGVLEIGACVHGYVEKSGFVFEVDVFIGTALVDMYSKCGCLDNALSVFELMREKNVLTWTSMATGLAIHGKGNEALELMDAMRVAKVEPNELTFTSLFSACCHVGLVEEGLKLFHNMASQFGLAPRIQHYGCIVDLLGRAGKLEEAYEFIASMPVEPDAILWRSLLSACNAHGDVVMGEKVGKILLYRHPKQSFADDESEDYVALSNVYASADRWLEVAMVREEMKERSIETKPGRSSVRSSIM